MTSTDWIHYIQDAYSTEPEHPWADKPEFSVFRHASNKKWFALFMTVKASLLGLPGACFAVLAGSLLGSLYGVFRAFRSRRIYPGEPASSEPEYSGTREWVFRIPGRRNAPDR